MITGLVVVGLNVKVDDVVKGRTISAVVLVVCDVVVVDDVVDDVVVGTLFTIDPQTELLYIVDGRTENNRENVDLLRDIGTRDIQVGISIVHFKDVMVLEMLTHASLSLSFQCPSPSGNGELSIEDEAVRNLARRDQVVKRLEQMRISHSVDNQGSIHVLNGILHIHPPYRSTDCVSKNEIVLQRVSQLLSTN